MPDAASDFDTIYAEFRPRLIRYLTGLVGRDEAEDVSQIALLRVHSALHDFRGEASLATWIYRIATNAALDHLRSRPARQTTEMAAATAETGAPAASELPGEIEEPSAEASFICDEMNACIRSFVDALPDGYRTVVNLSELEGFKDREIAEIIGISVESVKIRLHRARRELRKRLETGCDFDRTEANEFACDRKAPSTRSIA